jgi:hypothetical protein
MPARLRYQLQDITVPVGFFVIGRGVECQLTLDDPQVSRRHAALRVGTDSASIEDLGSRNGVFLNGARIEKSEPLRDGDHIVIGAQDLGFYFTEGPTSSPGSGRETLVTTLGEMRAADLRPVDPDDHAERTTYSATGPMAPVPGRAGSGLAIIGGVADKALSLGRAEEAERLLQRSLAEVRARAEAGEDVPPEVAERAAGYAVRLAAATGRGQWVDYVFQLYSSLGVLLPGRVVDELYAAVRKVKHTDRSVLHAYIARLREVSQGFGPSERFILQRLEGFERWAP